jgi:hypothetical protein
MIQSSKAVISAERCMMLAGSSLPVLVQNQAAADASATEGSRATEAPAPEAQVRFLDNACKARSAEGKGRVRGNFGSHSDRAGR